METTLRQELIAVGFDFSTGIIIVQDQVETCYSSPPGYSQPTTARVARINDPLLDLKFDDGYGSPECPRFIAEDEKYLYFPYQYDGSTGIVTVHKYIRYYLNPQNPTPYPGG